MAWKLNWTCHWLYANDDGNVLDKKICIGKKNIKTPLVASKEVGLEMNAEKTKCSSCLPDECLKPANKSFSLRVNIYIYLFICE